MLKASLEAEVKAYIQQHTHVRDEMGALVMPNSKAQERTIQSERGNLPVKETRVDDRRQDRESLVNEEHPVAG